MIAEFPGILSDAIAANPDVEPELAKRVMEVINGRKSLRRTLILNAMERHARAQGAADQGVDIEAIDWSKIDWAEVLGVVLKILLLFLPLVMGT